MLIAMSISLQKSPVKYKRGSDPYDPSLYNHSIIDQSKSSVTSLSGAGVAKETITLTTKAIIKAGSSS